MNDKFQIARTRYSPTGFAALNFNDEDTVETINQFGFKDILLSGPFATYLPKVDKFRSVFELGCEIVHGIPSLYEGVGLENIEIYVGRTTKGTIFSNARFKIQNGYDGMIAFGKCEMEKAKKFEHLYQAIVMKQQENDALCVKDVLNKRAHGGGPELDDVAVIYLAWKLSARPGYIGFPDAEVRQLIADELYDDERLEDRVPGRETLMTALEAAKRVGTKQHLYWGKFE